MGEAVIDVYEAKTNLSKLLDGWSRARRSSSVALAAPSPGSSPTSRARRQENPVGSQAGSKWPTTSPTRPNG